MHAQFGGRGGSQGAKGCLPTRSTCWPSVADGSLRCCVRSCVQVKTFMEEHAESPRQVSNRRSGLAGKQMHRGGGSSYRLSAAHLTGAYHASGLHGAAGSLGSHRGAEGEHARSGDASSSSIRHEAAGTASLGVPRLNLGKQQHDGLGFGTSGVQELPGKAPGA